MFLSENPCPMKRNYFLKNNFQLINFALMNNWFKCLQKVTFLA